MDVVELEVELEVAVEVEVAAWHILEVGARERDPARKLVGACQQLVRLTTCDGPKHPLAGASAPLVESEAMEAAPALRHRQVDDVGGRAADRERPVGKVAHRRSCLLGRAFSA